MLKLVVFFILLTGILCDNCSVTTLIAELYSHVDSEVDKVSFSEKIELPEDNFSLLIVDQNISRLCENSVEILNELTIIQIRNSNLIDIAPGAFNIAPTLALLKISYNPLTTLRAGVFNEVRSKELDLSHNSISVIEEGTFDNNSILEVVSLSYNAIKKMSSTWFRHSPNVYKLSIIFNELTRVPDGAFQHMAKTRGLKLRLSANMIHEVEENAFESIENIRNLWINGNKIRNLPETLFENITVQSLAINTNRLSCLPESLYKSKLEELQFLDNQQFDCSCLQKVREFITENDVDVLYPSIICEDKSRQVNVVYNGNRTFEIPLFQQ
ncbi:hypothetical protein JTB14_001735 [Gonioctena quinquepunctata]|nr:hypothetical protein JTB14_001735 [Gonioctena quinquepunctata]